MKTITKHIISLFFFFNLFSVFAENTIIVTEAMVAPTENENARIAYNQGNQFLHDGEYEKAEEQFRIAISEDINFVDAYDHLGIVLRRQDKFEEALEIFNKSISLNPENLVPYINIAVVFKSIQKPNEAISIYEIVRKLDPDYPESYYGIGETYYSYGYYEKAVPYLEQALRLYLEKENNHAYDAYFLLGICHYNLENWDNSLEFLKSAKPIYGNNDYLEDLVTEIESKTN